MLHIKSNHTENEIIPARLFTGVRMELKIKKRQKVTSVTAKNSVKQTRREKPKYLIPLSNRLPS